MNWLHKLRWKLWGDRLLQKKLDALDLAQLNLVEARIAATGDLTPELEELFATYREEKEKLA